MIQLVEPDEDMAVTAAHFKAETRMFLAGAYAAALTKHKKAEQITGDKEFKTPEKRNK